MYNLSKSREWHVILALDGFTFTFCDRFTAVFIGFVAASGL